MRPRRPRGRRRLGARAGRGGGRRRHGRRRRAARRPARRAARGDRRPAPPTTSPAPRSCRTDPEAGVRARRHRRAAARDGARAPRRRPPVRQRRERRPRLRGGAPRPAAEVRTSARSPTRSAPSSAAVTEQPLRCTVLRRRRARSSTARPGRRSSPSPARSAAARRSAPPTPATGCSTPRSCPRARASGSSAAPGACAAATIAEQRDVRHARGTRGRGRAAAGHASSTSTARCATGGMEHITVEHRAYELVVG